MNTSESSIKIDVANIGRLSIVPVILEVICRTTGMGFAAVARVTEEQWIACAVRDEIKFGLMAGGELKIDTTICHEIRQNGKPVIIDHVAEDEFYCTHHTPAMYGFQSYISMPIIRKNGNFFGTLCAIDPNPAILNTPDIIGMFKTYAGLISFHLNAAELLSKEDASELENHSYKVMKEQLLTLTGTGDDEQSQTSINTKREQFANRIRQSSIQIKELINDLKTMSKID